MNEYEDGFLYRHTIMLFYDVNFDNNMNTMVERHRHICQNGFKNSDQTDFYNKNQGTVQNCLIKRISRVSEIWGFLYRGIAFLFMEFSELEGHNFLIRGNSLNFIVKLISTYVFFFLYHKYLDSSKQ